MKMKVITGGNQMSLIRDTEEVVKFLEFAARKSILSEQSINFRMTACHNLFSVLNEEEDNLDYILANLDLLVNRFRNKNTNVRASTLKVYKSRVKSSLEDFRAWSTDPFAWERSLTEKSKAAASRSSSPEVRKERAARKSTSAKSSGKGHSEVTTESAPSNEGHSSRILGDVRRVSFPIRDGVSVEVSFPADGLTTRELNRLGMFLYPYCQDLDAKSTRWPTLN